MKTIFVDQDIFDFLRSKGTSPDEDISAIIRRELHTPQSQQSVEIDDATYAFLVSQASEIGESASDILRRELQLSGDPAEHPPNTISFHIRLGTGSSAWNTSDSTVLGTVGDTLRIINDDSVSHRLHTGGRPFPHPAGDIAPGQSADFVLESPFDPSVDGPLSDHDRGPQAHFFLRVVARP